MLILITIHILSLAGIAFWIIYKIRESGQLHLFLLMQGNWMSVLRSRDRFHRRTVDVNGLAVFAFFLVILFSTLCFFLHPSSADEWVMYAIYVSVIPYAVLGLVVLIFYLMLWYTRYARKKREARTTPDHKAISTALKAGRMSEAMRLYKVVNCLNEDNINAALQQVLPVSSARSSITNAIHEATSELLALQSNSSVALAAGVPQNHISLLTKESENALNTIWMIADRIVAVRRQGVDSPRIQNALKLQEQRIRNLTEAAHEARVNLAEWTLYGWEGRDIEKAQEKLSDLVTASRELMDTSAAM